MAHCVSTSPHFLPNHRLNQLRSPVLGAAKSGFEFVAEFHQVIDFGDDALLFWKRRKRDNNPEVVRFFV